MFEATQNEARDVVDRLVVVHHQHHPGDRCGRAGGPRLVLLVFCDVAAEERFIVQLRSVYPGRRGAMGRGRVILIGAVNGLVSAPLHGSGPLNSEAGAGGSASREVLHRRQPPGGMGRGGPRHAKARRRADSPSDKEVGHRRAPADQEGLASEGFLQYGRCSISGRPSGFDGTGVGRAQLEEPFDHLLEQDDVVGPAEVGEVPGDPAQGFGTARVVFG